MKSPLRLPLFLFGLLTVVFSLVVACGGDGTDDEDGVGAAGELGSFTPGEASSQPPTAPGAGFPPENPNSSSSSSGEPEPDASSSSSGGSSSSSSGGSSGEPDGGSDTDAGDAG